MKLVRSGRLWVGDETCYLSVKHLMPNHYLDIGSLTVKRYWPNRRLEKMDLSAACKQSCDYLKGVLKAVTLRHEVMMAVTSGIDSRSLLAATREIKDKIYYFINHQDVGHRYPDISVTRKIFERIGVSFHVHDVSEQVDKGFRKGFLSNNIHVHDLWGPVDEEFKKLFLNNTFMSMELYLHVIYNVYFKNHANKVNLLGVSEIGRDYYGAAPRDLDGYYLAHCLGYRNSSYATAQCEKWLREARRSAELCNVDIMSLFLWEVLLGNWGVVGNSESDIAIEEFDPYDSHYIYEIMLSVHGDNKKKGRIGKLFEAMFKEMWPELLDFPFNPVYTFKGWIAYRFPMVCMYLKAARYRFDRRKYCRLADKEQA